MSAGTGGTSAGSAGELEPSSVISSSAGLSGAAASTVISDTIETGTVAIISRGSRPSFGQAIRARPITPACSRTDPRKEGAPFAMAQRSPSTGSASAVFPAVSVIRFSLAKPLVDSRAITRATA